MLIAIALTLHDVAAVDYRWILAGMIVGSAVGAVGAFKAPMTAMPEMVAMFNGFGGGASALVALSVFLHKLAGVGPGEPVRSPALLGGVDVAWTTMLSLIVGTVTFSGSVAAFLKLRGMIGDRPVLLPGRHATNVALLLATLAVSAVFVHQAFSVQAALAICLAVLVVSLVLGVTSVLPIGGADMPVVISLLNSYSGLAAAMTGFVLSSPLLIISGSLVGASGLILCRIMCKAMNRSLTNVLFGGFGAVAAGDRKEGYASIRESSPEEAAMLLEDARSVVIVPGYGLAVSQAQHATRELGDLLEKRGTHVRYAIHPVAGRMPGHMNVLLAEADVSYDKLLEMDEINPDFKSTDVAIVLGANDVVNPAALHDQKSPIYGMPILNVHEARSVIVVKRSLSPGFAGIRNELFEYPNTVMVFGDARKVLTEILHEIKA
jgi:NAD(P) transhydrogenase subunit beta